MNLTLEDINAIQIMTGLATTSENTFVAIDAITVSDTSGNQVKDISVINALKAYAFNSDSARPMLLAFDFDVDSGMLTLYFDEFVNVSHIATAHPVFLLPYYGLRKRSIAMCVS